ncbi:uncharacterized protein LOC134442063 [Engraulis encrasicolus]|uniref:uncharacterized protein LOC134442063 n=1 Tax=Engraulis encrasicolus TaxID=184585 RepID=UPI002FD4246D
MPPRNKKSRAARQRYASRQLSSEVQLPVEALMTSEQTEQSKVKPVKTIPAKSSCQIKLPNKPLNQTCQINLPNKPVKESQRKPNSCKSQVKLMQNRKLSSNPQPLNPSNSPPTLHLSNPQPLNPSNSPPTLHLSNPQPLNPSNSPPPLKPSTSPSLKPSSSSLSVTVLSTNATDDSFQSVQAPARPVLMGSFYQGHSRFGDIRDKQCGTVSLVGVLRSKTKNVLTWTARDLDNILIRGSALYRCLKSANKIRGVTGLVSVRELPARHHEWNSEFSINFADSYMGFIDVNEYDDDVSDYAMPLDAALQRTLLSNDCCLFTVSSSTAAIVKEGSWFAVIDSHGRKTNANRRLVSSVSFFSSIESLYEYLLNLGRSYKQVMMSVPFEVTGVAVTMPNQHPTPDVSSPFPSNVVEGEVTENVLCHANDVAECSNAGEAVYDPSATDDVSSVQVDDPQTADEVLITNVSLCQQAFTPLSSEEQETLCRRFELTNDMFSHSAFVGMKISTYESEGLL